LRIRENPSAAISEKRGEKSRESETPAKDTEGKRLSKQKKESRGESELLYGVNQG